MIRLERLTLLGFALRNIFRNRLRTLLTLAAIASGVAALILSAGFVEDVFVQLRESTIHSRLGHLQVYRAGYTEHGRQAPEKYRIETPAGVIAQAAGLPGVREVMTRLQFSGLANNGQADLPIVGEGIEPDKEARLGTATTLVAGRQLSDTDVFATVIGEGVAAALQVKPGDALNVTVSTAGGAINSLEFEVVGIFRTFSKEYDDRAVRIPMTAAQELLHTRAVHGVVLLLADTRLTDAAVTTLRMRLAPQGYEVKAWHELADFYEKTVALYRRQFGALQLIILLMLALSVAGTVNTAMHERTGEFGTVLALGLRPRQVFRQVMTEYALLGLLGGLMGMALGALLALAVNAAGFAMPPPPGSNLGYIVHIRLTAGGLGEAMVVGLLATVLAALLPARRAARLEIAAALRHNI